MMIRFSIIATLFLGLLPACGPVDAACSSDNDCKGDRVCNAGACQDPGVTPRTNNPSGNPNNPSGNNQSGNNTSGEFSCCINDVGYRCPNQAAFDMCVGFDLGSCLENCGGGPDFSCMDRCFEQLDTSNPDPSGCQSDPSVTCEGGGTCIQGSACDLDSDCDSGNCSGGHCYANDVGCKCDLDSDCDSENCSGGECRGNGRGSACDLDSDCTSGNCTGGKCAGNGFGEPCDLDSDCDSGNCSGGTCSGN